MLPLNSHHSNRIVIKSAYVQIPNILLIVYKDHFCLKSQCNFFGGITMQFLNKIKIVFYIVDRPNVQSFFC